MNKDDLQFFIEEFNAKISEARLTCDNLKYNYKNLCEYGDEDSWNARTLKKRIAFYQRYCLVLEKENEKLKELSLFK